jgi:hypothetical protein
MLDLIEIELTRIRRMAEHAGDGFLLYLLDMAILEANRRSRVRAEGDPARPPGSEASDLGDNLATELKVVR